MSADRPALASADEDPALPILRALDAAGSAVSLPWLAKRLGLRASQVLRTLAPFGVDGAGWLAIEVDEQAGQWRIQLTPAGAARLKQESML